MPSRSRTPQSAAALRKLIDAAMELERQSMHLYCKFENLFGRDPSLREFWFDMAQHESRHFGALALVAGLLEGASRRPLAVALTPTRIGHLRKLLERLHDEVDAGIDLERAFEIAIEVEGSEIEDVVLDLLQALKGVGERERAVQLLIHDLGDLSYMIEKYTTNASLLARADKLLENHVGRLRKTLRRPRPPARRSRTTALR